MASRPALTSEQFQEVVRLYEAGSSLGELSRRFGAGKETIRTRLIKAGAFLRQPRHLSEEQIQQALVAYEAGESTEVLGARFGVHPMTVGNALRARGLVLRPSGGRVGNVNAKRVLIDAQIDEIIRRYEAGSNTEELGRLFGVTGNTVCKWLRRRGLEIRPRDVLSSEQQKEALELYEAGFSTLTLGEHFGVSPQTIANVMERKGRGDALRDPGGRRRLSLREDAFDILTPESAYWLGVLATDGCSTGWRETVDSVKLGLGIKDSEHVYAFRSFLGSGHAVGLTVGTHPTDPGKEIGMCRFAVRSRRLVEAVARYGIVRRKTLTMAAHDSVAQNRDFWRGGADGDGHIGIHASNQGPDATFKFDSASEVFALQFLKFLHASGVRGDQHVTCATKKGSLAKEEKYAFKLGGAAALDAIVLLYVDGDPVLARKADAAAEAILRGAAGELVGTIRESWNNPQAEAWARGRLGHRVAV